MSAVAIHPIGVHTIETFEHLDHALLTRPTSLVWSERRRPGTAEAVAAWAKARGLRVVLLDNWLYVSIDPNCTVTVEGIP